MTNIGLTKIEQIFEEVKKLSWEDAREEDSEEEKKRKLSEKNYNTRVQTHIRDAISRTSILAMRGIAPIAEPMPYSKAIELCSVL